uniref:Uncharacterized protein n=1 Tax=Anguilla anguilla TaxID=7936 RepID=A0A0E9SIC0_ANGAN
MSNFHPNFGTSNYLWLQLRSCGTPADDFGREVFRMRRQTEVLTHCGH